MSRLILFTALLLPAAIASAAERPNIVVLLADDLGYRDIGCYGGPVKTPTLDNLASKGTRFTDFYSGCAVCSPSRATLLTGRHHIRTGVYSWIHDASQKSHLLEREITLAEILKGADYEDTAPVPASIDLTTPESILNAADTLTTEAEPLSESYCDACSSCCDGRFRSDREFDSFIEPISNPVWSMDPRSMTRVRFIFLNQMIPGSSIIGKGGLQVYALQISVALNERWSIIAVKDGYNTLQAAGVPNAQGWSDAAAGLKYVLHRDPCSQFIVSTGLVYEISRDDLFAFRGAGGVFQGNGDGVWNPFIAAGKQWGCYHAVGTVGWHIPNNGNKESESIYYSLHLDRQLTDCWYAVFEFNGINYTDSGNALAANQEGGDWINLGANNVTGNDFATVAAGATVKLTDDLTAAAAYEFPVMGRRDLFDNRFYLQLSLKY